MTFTFFKFSVFQMQVEASDVLLLVKQFLGEHQLNKTLDALQQETGTQLTLIIPHDITDCIHAGAWDQVLSLISTVSIQEALLIDLYEHVSI